MNTTAFDKGPMVHVCMQCVVLKALVVVLYVLSCVPAPYAVRACMQVHACYKLKLVGYTRSWALVNVV